MRITNWKARRAGGRITVTGSAGGGPVKIVGVDVIEPRGGQVIATDKNGENHTLVI